MADERFEIRLSGSGEQGVVLAGVILAEAAALYDDKNAIQSQSYGPEARGGAARSEVVISDTEIDNPKAESIDLLLALTQEACDKYVGDLKPGGVLVADRDRVPLVPQGDYTVHHLPLVATATERLGKVQAVNIVSLGALAAVSGVVSEAALRDAVVARVPKGTEDLHRKALEAGYQLVRDE